MACASWRRDSPDSGVVDAFLTHSRKAAGVGIMASNPTSTGPLSTTETGAPAPSDAFTLSVGANGPLLLHDHHFIGQMAHFNRERVPERNVQAKGGGAFGFSEVTAEAPTDPTVGALQR